MKLGEQTFRETWAVDFEYAAPDGEPPEPLCMVARRLEDGRTLRLWRDELRALPAAPFATDADALLVAFYASAEAGCFLALGWPLPANTLDLFAEFRNATNGLPTPCGAGLLGALAYYGIDGLAVAEKESMRSLALRGGEYTADERAALLDYCEGDVAALDKLLSRMRDTIDLPRALLRGRYMVAAARIEANGVPIDAPMLDRLRAGWNGIQDRLIARIDADYGVFDGRTFKAERWAGWLGANGVPWPRLPSGALALDDDTFREMARAYPAVAPIRELRVSLSQMRLSELAVGADGRNRCLLSAFRARTGRKQPSNTRFIFGPAVWLRGLIAPDPGWAVAYVDWSQQEFGIAAALSGDWAMIAAYESGDPYLTFAKQAGAVPADATKATHGPTREQYKACVLAVQYGMGADSLAARIGQPPAIARDLLRRHRETYRRFWQWSDAAVSYAMLRGELYTAFGWKVRTGPDVNPRMLANFPMQANGAEMLRLACIFATDRGIAVCAPVHDASLIEAPAWQIADAVRETQRAMADASAAVLEGFRLRTEAKVFTWPERYADERGRRMWETVQAVLSELPPAETCSAGAHGLTPRRNGRCCTGAHPTCSAGADPVQSLFSLFTEGGTADAELGPGAAAAADAATAETEAVGAAAAPEARRTVSERADSLELAVRRLVAAGPGGSGGRSAVAAGWDDPKANGQAVVHRPDGDARQPLRGPSWAAVAGSGGTGQRGAPAGLRAGSDDPGCVFAPDALPGDWREAFEERAGIMQFDGKLSRADAEAAAWTDTLRRIGERNLVAYTQLSCYSAGHGRSNGHDSKGDRSERAYSLSHREGNGHRREPAFAACER